MSSQQYEHMDTPRVAFALRAVDVPRDANSSLDIAHGASSPNSPAEGQQPHGVSWPPDATLGTTAMPYGYN